MDNIKQWYQNETNVQKIHWHRIKNISILKFSTTTMSFSKESMSQRSEAQLGVSLDRQVMYMTS